MEDRQGQQMQIQVDITSIDNNAEQILKKLREGQQPLSLEKGIKLFLSTNIEICQQLIQTLEFKNCYYIFKKLEKVLIQVLKQFGPYDITQFPVKNIILNLIDIQSDINKVDLTPVLKHPIELFQRQFPQDNIKVYQLMDYVLLNLFICINNAGAIYMMRNKPQEALSQFYKAIFSRLSYQNCYKSIYQGAILMLNSAFCLKNLEKLEDAGQLMNKGIITLEYIDKYMADNGGVLSQVIEKGTSMICLIEFLYNKNDQIYQEVSPVEKDRMTFLLSSAYKYYGDILLKQKREKEAEFCKSQSEILYKKFRKALSKTPQSVLQQAEVQIKSPPKLTQQMIQTTFPSNNNEDQNKFDDNFSHASFQTMNTNTTMGGGFQFISKDNIIFQKYIHVNEIRYKLVIVQIKDFNCVQILLYNKPNNFLKKIIVGFNQLLDYARLTQQEAFKDQNTLNSFFKDISRKLQIDNGNLKLREIEYYNTIEEFMKNSRQTQNVAPTTAEKKKNKFQIN